MRYKFSKEGIAFNFQELLDISTTDADVLYAFYLHSHYKQPLIKEHKIVEELALDEYPTIDFNLYTIKEYNSKVRYSNFKCFNCMVWLKYVEVLTSSLPDKDKVEYLRLISLCPPYSDEKIVEVTKVPRMLQFHELVRVTKRGVILIKERS
jgi:hypothetical protein